MFYPKITVARKVNGNIHKKANNSTLKDNAQKWKALQKSPIIKKPYLKKVTIMKNVNYLLD